MKTDTTYRITIFLLGLLYIGLGSKYLIDLYCNSQQVVIKIIMPIILGLFFILGGIGILKCKKWGRLISLIGSYVLAVAALLKIILVWRKYNFSLAVKINPTFVIHCLFFVVFPIFFLTRPKIKEQFK